MGKRKIATFSKVMTEEEAEKEKQRSSSIGQALKKAEEEYSKRRKK